MIIKILDAIYDKKYANYKEVCDLVIFLTVYYAVKAF